MHGVTAFVIKSYEKCFWTAFSCHKCAIIIIWTGTGLFYGVFVMLGSHKVSVK